jgi:hypothetical protein
VVVLEENNIVAAAGKVVDKVVVGMVAVDVAADSNFDSEEADSFDFEGEVDKKVEADKSVGLYFP